MREFFEKIPVFVIVVVVVSVVRALMRAAKGGKATPPAVPGADETEDQRRVREIQERIRRIAAERRGTAPAAPGPPPLRVPDAPRPVVLHPMPPVPPIDPFGGPARRVREEVLKRLRPVTTETPPPLVARKVTADVEKQEQLRDEMRAVEEKKFLAGRQAQHRADAREAEAQSEAGLRSTARGRLLEDVRDPASLRRAFVLREVLGAPIGLR